MIIKAITFIIVYSLIVSFLTELIVAVGERYE